MSAAWPGLSAVLDGDRVRLEPLTPAHAADLRDAGADPELFAWFPPPTPAGDFDGWLAAMLGGAERGELAPFATVDKERGAAVGATSFLTLRPEHRGLEIGNTWLRRDAWATGVNVEAKLLQLGHAFDTLGCIRVELKTDANNERSRGAMAAIPARFEGIFRHHMVYPDRLRDSAYYAVIDSDWPEVREALRARLAR